MSTNENAEYLVGDEATISGVVVHVGNVGGNFEYTVAVATEGNNRPVNIPPAVATQATATHSEVLELNAKAEAQAIKDGEKADKELADKEDAEDVDATDSPKVIRQKTATPDPAKTPAGQGAKGTVPATK